MEPKPEPKPEPVTNAPTQRPLFEPEQPVLRVTPEPKLEEPVSEKVVYTLYDAAETPAAMAPVSTPNVNTPRVDTPRTEVTEARLTPNEHQARVEERVAKVREMSQRLRTPNGLSDLEREPAYKRKNIQLNDAPHSSDSTVSRYTLSEETDENGDRRVELKRNNPYLHDNVD